MSIIHTLLKLQEIKANGTCPDDTASLRASLPPEVLEKFYQFQRRGKRGVVPLRGNACSGCHLQQPIAVIQTVHSHDTPKQCVHCGRFLYLPENLPEPSSTSD